MPSESFRDLKAWQAAVELATDIYRITEIFPATERYGLTAQIRRAVVSVSSNIAEGKGRQSDAGYRYFLTVANGSLYEVESQLHVSERLGYLAPDQTRTACEKIARTIRLVHGLIRYLERQPD